MANDSVVEMMKGYARASMQVHYWQILVDHHRINSPKTSLERQFAEKLEEHKAEAKMLYERLQDRIPNADRELVDALDTLDEEMADIAESQAKAAIDSGAANGLNSAKNAVTPQAAYASRPVQDLQAKLERAYGSSIPRDEPPDGAPKGKLLKFGKRLLSTLPIVGTGMALLEAAGSMAEFEAMQAAASELERQGYASPSDIQNLRNLANQFITAAGVELAAGLSPIPGVAEGGEIALAHIKEKLREAHNALKGKLADMKPVEDIEASSFDTVANELSEATGEEFSADDIEKMYNDNDSDLDELRERVNTYRERFRDHNNAIKSYKDMLNGLDSTIKQLDKIKPAQVMVSNDVPEPLDEGFTPTRVAYRKDAGNSGPQVT